MGNAVKIEGILKTHSKITILWLGVNSLFFAAKMHTQSIVPSKNNCETAIFLECAHSVGE